jgi:omega-amidase
MQDLRITIVQADQHWENKELNFRHYENILVDFYPTDLILLPEMFHTGFTMNAADLSESMQDSEGINWLRKLAQRSNAAVYTSLIIREGNSFYNRGVFVYPNGKIEKYDKRKTFGLAGEDRVYTAGSSENIVEYNNWKINLQICYDLRFPEIVRNKIEDNGKAKYDLILYVANWPQRRVEHWRTLLKARAIENQCYVAGANRIGFDGLGIHYSGDSAFIDPLGEAQEINIEKDRVRTFTASRAQLEVTRKNLPFLKDA